MSVESWNATRLALAVAVLAVLFGVGLVDVLIAYRWGASETISAVIQEWSRDWPVLPLLAGLVLGHLFWPLRIGAGPGKGV